MPEFDCISRVFWSQLEEHSSYCFVIQIMQKVTELIMFFSGLLLVCHILDAVSFSTYLLFVSFFFSQY